MAAYLPSFVLIVVTIVGIAGTWFNNRNDRALAHQEADLAKKLIPSSEAAEQLNQVVAFRIYRWHNKVVLSNAKYLWLGLTFLGVSLLLTLSATVITGNTGRTLEAISEYIAYLAVLGAAASLIIGFLALASFLVFESIDTFGGMKKSIREESERRRQSRIARAERKSLKAAAKADGADGQDGQDAVAHASAPGLPRPATAPATTEMD